MKGKGCLRLNPRLREIQEQEKGWVGGGKELVKNLGIKEQLDFSPGTRGASQYSFQYAECQNVLNRTVIIGICFFFFLSPLSS